MLSSDDAKAAVQKVFPDARVKKVVEYQGKYIVQAFLDLPEEEDMDPFFSVDQTTGDVMDFSIITDGDISEITALFTQVNEEVK